MSKGADKFKEIEARWINLDKNDIAGKLEKIGAKMTGDFFFREWIFAHPEWKKDNRRLRIRTDGINNWITYKANKTWAIDSTEEVEMLVPSAEDAIRLISAMGVPQTRYAEHKRRTFELGNIVFDMDGWPQIPMVLEIEAPTEDEVRKGAQLLGLSWADAIFEDQFWVHKKYYGIDLSNVPDYRFPA